MYWSYWLYKRKYSLEDIIIEENLFLYFHNKINPINQEKEKIANDIDNMNFFKVQLEIFSTSEEEIFNTINAILDKPSNDFFSKITKEIDSFELLFHIFNIHMGKK